MCDPCPCVRPKVPPPASSSLRFPTTTVWKEATVTWENRPHQSRAGSGGKHGDIGDWTLGCLAFAADSRALHCLDWGGLPHHLGHPARKAFSSHCRARSSSSGTVWGIEVLCGKKNCICPSVGNIPPGPDEAGPVTGALAREEQNRVGGALGSRGQLAGRLPCLSPRRSRGQVRSASPGV